MERRQTFWMLTPPVNPVAEKQEPGTGQAWEGGGAPSRRSASVMGRGASRTPGEGPSNRWPERREVIAETRHGPVVAVAAVAMVSQGNATRAGEGTGELATAPPEGR